MGSLSRSATIALALLLTGCGPAPAELDKTQAAEERARQWLALMDAGHYARSWEAATQLFQLSIAKDEWEARARRTQLDAGAAADRTLVAAKYTATYPMTPLPGEYVIVQYRTRFGGRAGIETLYMRLASDGVWRPDGYFIRPDPRGAPRGPPSPRPPPAPTGLVVGSGNIYGAIVADLDEAVEFYRDGLGFEMQRPPVDADSNPQQNAIFGLHEQARLRQRIGRAPDLPGSIEILQISGAGGRQAERRIDDPGAVMLAVIVRDIDATLARVKQLGAPVVTPGGAPKSLGDYGQFRAVVVRDPAGHFVELVQTLRAPAAGADANVLGVRVRHTVHDLTRSLPLYRDALGLQSNIAAIPEWQGDERVLDLLGLASTAQYRFTTLTVPTSGLVMELIEFRGSRSRPEPARIADPGSTRMQLRVADIDAAIVAVTQAGGELVSAGGRPLDVAAGDSARKIGIVRDPDDLFLVLIQ
jgi:catechol 2,3-dioxygenase-like lactoylglutathione lyase family enzyme